MSFDRLDMIGGILAIDVVQYVFREPVLSYLYRSECVLTSSLPVWIHES